MQIQAHTSIIGDTGYNCHARNFFKALNRYVPVKVRNYTVGSSWIGHTSDCPHEGEYYMDDELRTMLTTQTLSTSTGPMDFEIYSDYQQSGSGQKINIVLNDNTHQYFRESYAGPSIAYNVWETTRQPDEFFNQLKKFDQVWVPSEWQRACTIEQGIPEDRVKVVPEGVDTDKFKPVSDDTSFPKNRPFRFLVVGRWEYRKSTKEIIQAFIESFPESADVELILLTENPFAYDGLNSTHDRLSRFKLKHKGIRSISHVSKDEYIRLIQESDVFVSCARGEGWNLPLIEAMACGVPSIYSDWGAQLQFAKGKGIPVKILHETSAGVENSESWSQSTPGNFAEPDFTDLAAKMIDVYNNFQGYKKKALAESEIIRKEFTWENSAMIANRILKDYTDMLEKRKAVVSVIIARADTPKRKALLRQCIESLDTEIILSTNYLVDTDIQEKVDHLVFEKDNPILLKQDFDKYGVGYYRWTLDSKGNSEHHPYEYEHSYAAYRLARVGLEKAEDLDKKIVHIINYDYLISNQTLLDHESILIENDIAVYNHEGLGEANRAYCSGFISGKLPALLDYFKLYQNKDEYYRSIPGFNILEINIFNHYNNREFKIKELNIDSLKLSNKVNQESAGNTVIPYKEPTLSSFKSISDHNDCDKTTYHRYDRHYPMFMEKFRDKQINLFEIGIDEGRSLKTWEQYFPFANIWGMDISKQYSNSRCKIFIGDQSRLEDLKRVASSLPKCEVIVDDGSHVPEHQLKSFYYLFQNLLEWGGVYVIEDIECSYWKPDSLIYGYEASYLNLIDYFTKLNHSIQSNYSNHINDLHIESITYGENCIIIQKKKSPEPKLDYRFKMWLGELPEPIQDTQKMINPENQINIHFVDGPFLEITGGDPKKYLVEFIDSDTNEIVYSNELSAGQWARSSRRWFTNWLIKIQEPGSDTVTYKYDASNKRVYISIESKSLGDTLAWFPYVEEFRKKHRCQVVCSTFWNNMFSEKYPEIEFIQPGEAVDSIYAMYRIGWYNRNEDFDVEMHPVDFKAGPLQKTASDILGLSYSELRPMINMPERNVRKKIGIGFHSTAQAKYWNNPEGWQELVNWIRDNGYEPIILSKEEDGYMGNFFPSGVTHILNSSIEQTINTLRECSAFVGISSGLTWLAWACEVPVVEITGFVDPVNDPDSGILKVNSPKGTCTGCMNRKKFDPGNWNWCPDQEGTHRQFECSKMITAETVIKGLEKILI
jgi:autotransporter strand-loop-strand O-heptosyltransferase